MVQLLLAPLNNDVQEVIDLHSIMVQLLYQQPSLLIPKSYKFTFHYGSITISTASGTDTSKSTFTFHYGSITI